ncbi:MAG: hypothetical protein ACRDXX_08655 [Stackebrandtia sp.]
MTYSAPNHRQEVTISGGTAFKAGFFGFFGVLVAYLVVALIAGAVVLVLALAGANIF